MAVLLVLRFVAELALLAALAWGGWHLSDSTPISLLAAVLMPVLAAVVWGRWVAPRAGHRLRDVLVRRTNHRKATSATSVTAVIGIGT